MESSFGAEARPVFVEQDTQGVTGAGGAFVVVLDHRVSFLAAKLPRKFSPQGSDHSAVRLFASIMLQGSDAVSRAFSQGVRMIGCPNHTLWDGPASSRSVVVCPAE
jgi:hypothetical protein